MNDLLRQIGYQLSLTVTQEQHPGGDALIAQRNGFLQRAER